MLFFSFSPEPRLFPQSFVQLIDLTQDTLQVAFDALVQLLSLAITECFEAK
jgi:hypothetical protein